MEDSNVLDSLVRIASMGTAGVCVLVIFIAGFLIWKLSDEASNRKVGLIKFYMKICLVIAGISFISGLANFFIKQDDVIKANEDKDQAVKMTAEIQSVVAQELPKIEKAQKDIEQVQNIIAENPPKNAVASKEANATLDTATSTINKIDMIRLRKFTKRPIIRTN